MLMLFVKLMLMLLFQSSVVVVILSFFVREKQKLEKEKNDILWSVIKTYTSGSHLHVLLSLISIVTAS